MPSLGSRLLLHNPEYFVVFLLDQYIFSRSNLIFNYLIGLNILMQTWKVFVSYFTSCTWHLTLKLLKGISIPQMTIIRWRYFNTLGHFKQTPVKYISYSLESSSYMGILIWEFSFPLLLSFTFCTYLFMFFFPYIIHIFVQWYKALLNLNLCMYFLTT